MGAPAGVVVQSPQSEARVTTFLGLEARSSLNRKTRLAFLLRALLSLFLLWIGYSQRLAPDEETFDAVGWALSLFWTGDLLALPEKIVLGHTPVGYFYVNAFFFFMFGHTSIPIRIANAFVGAFSGRYVYLLARGLFGESVAERATTLYLFFPSLVLWSSLNIRDTWVILFILFISWKSYLLLHRYTLATLVEIAGALLALSLFRDHLFYAVAGPPVIALLIGRRGNLVRNLLVALLVSIPILLLLRQGVVREKTQQTLSLEALSEMRQNMAVGTSSFAPDADISTPIGAITFLPIGLAYFFFSPFPWQITSVLKLISVPEMLIVYYLFPATIRGLRYAIKHHLREALQVLLVTGLLTLTYALGEGNVGTLYRHRAQASAFYLIFAALGLELARTPPLRPKKPYGAAALRSPQLC